MVRNWKKIILCSLILFIVFINIGCKDINKNEGVSSSKESIEINDKLETKIIDIKEDNYCPVKLEFQLGEELNLDLSSRDDIVVKVIDKNTKEVVSESNKAWGEYIIGDDDKFGRGNLIKPGIYSIEVSKEELYGFNLEDVFIHFEIHKDGNNIYSYTYPKEDIRVNIRQVQANPADFGRLYNFLLNNDTINVSNVEVIGYGKGQDKVYKELHKLSLGINPNEEKVISIPSNIGIVDLKVITRCGDLYNEQELKIDDAFVLMGENGHIEVQSLSPNYEDFGVKYKWEISNLNNINKANVRVTTLDNKEVLTEISIEPNQVVSIDTLVEKGNTINIHTMQGDGSYVSRKVSVDENMIKFKDVDVKNIDVDINNYGRMLKWSVKNTNSSGKANVIVRDGAGKIISQIDLNYNQEHVFDIDVNRGRCIIVETRMGNGKYSSKKYNIASSKNKEDVKVSKLEVLANKVVRYELENILNHKVKVILVTEDDLTVIDSFDLSVGEKKVIDIDSSYVKKFKVKTLQYDGSYSIVDINFY